MTGTSQIVKKSPNHHAGLILIAAYKILCALLFVLVGVGALRLLHKDVDDFAWHALVEVLHWNPESRVVSFLLERAELLDDPMLKRIGFGAFCYGAVCVAEGIGLYLEKVWGEVLTILITASFLPFEIHELFRRVTPVRVSLLAINLVVLGYLLYLVGEKGARRAKERHAFTNKAV
ncbi:DUF2127 domain-containing protein [Occallatibacter riparius]|uniref:DUF2127 domain-containing protein n=1 Tax=Occallatibacter riparius TaxID=1002689 RepID=A0A9J7BMH2_9BACT|nr:DUF2127 domain-containing protein [Occallatibacter riparius]UWZ82110.1 DUF2127 domain-containing protein [Occallatibacter riparius]